MKINRQRVANPLWPRGLMRGSADGGFLELGFVSRLKHGCLSLVSVVRCQIEASALGWSFVQRSPTECVVTECDREKHG